jgi:HAD superfamily hydrolase (TIGR01459 family)
VQQIVSLTEIVDQFETVVFDQWGVLHNGTSAYPGAIAAVEALSKGPAKVAVLSNSGKRSEPNSARITSMGFRAGSFATVMTSGEALWRDFLENQYPGATCLFAICGHRDDAMIWAQGLPNLIFTTDISAASGVLLMGLSDEDENREALDVVLAQAAVRGLPLFCSNPDKASPRQDGQLVRSPGALAEQYEQAGGNVFYYGKPYGAIFNGLQRQLGLSDPSRILMIGDSLEHDVAGAQGAGWKTLFIQGGLHAASFKDGRDPEAAIVKLCRAHNCREPNYFMEFVRS